MDQGQGFRPHAKPRFRPNKMVDYGKCATEDEVRQSILQMRRVYKELTEKQFITFYSRRYGITAAAIERTLREYLPDMQP